MSIVLALCILFFIAEMCGIAMLMQIGGLGIIVAIILILSLIFHGAVVFSALFAATERKKKEKGENET